MSDFPLDWLRGQFPSLEVQDKGQRRIYLDNPAGTQAPLTVGNAIRDAVLFSNANLGGDFVTSQSAEAIIVDGHAAMADFYGCSPREVIIGANMTTLTYHFSRMIAKKFAPGDEIIVTQMDHEGNVSPWLQIAQEAGLVVRKLAFNPDSWQIETADLEALINERTRLLALNYASNLTGSINPVKPLVALAKSAGLMTYVDAVQLAPHALVDVRDIDCDFLISSSYKFFGPHLGILYARQSVLEQLEPYKCRCSSDELPYRFETGTPQIELVAGLGAAVDHFAMLGEAVGGSGNRRELVAKAFEASIRHENVLAHTLVSGLQSLKGLTIQGISDPDRFAHRVPTVSFTLDDITPHALVERLNSEGIFCWSGHNYAWEVVHQLGIDPDKGVVRIGIAAYNTPAEIDETLESVARNVAMLRQQR